MVPWVLWYCVSYSLILWYCVLHNIVWSYVYDSTVGSIILHIFTYYSKKNCCHFFQFIYHIIIWSIPMAGQEVNECPMHSWHVKANLHQPLIHFCKLRGCWPITRQNFLTIHKPPLPSRWIQNICPKPNSFQFCYINYYMLNIFIFLQ